MRRAAVAALVLVVLLVPAPPALAVNPLDDDAGTGGDAPDLFWTGTPPRIGPGNHTGRLATVADPADAFSFDAEAGARYRVTFTMSARVAELQVRDPEGIGRARLEHGGSALVTASETGPWMITVISDVTFTPPIAPYAFTLHEVDAEGQLTWIVDSGYIAVEARWRDPTAFRAEAFSRTRDTDSPAAQWTEIDAYCETADGELEYAGGIARMGSWAHGGDLVELREPETPEGAPRISFGAGGTAGSAAAASSNWVGGVRVVAWGTTPGWFSVLTFEASAPVDLVVTRGSAEDVRAWVARENGTIPGAGGPREHRVDAEATHASYFIVDAHDTHGNLTAPDGRSRHVDDSWAFAVTTEPGTWTARVAAGAPLTGEVERPVLVHAIVRMPGLLPAPQGWLS